MVTRQETQQPSQDVTIGGSRMAMRSDARPSIQSRRADRWQQRGASGANGLLLARGLGWVSIGLGLAQIISPRGVARMTGVEDDRGLMPAIGLREIACGIGILAQRRPTGWLWGRVAGDAMDLAILGTALRSRDARRDRIAATMAAVGGIMALDYYCARQLSQGAGRAAGRGIRVVKSIAINRPREELYRAWRDLENLPRFVSHLESVRVIGDNRSHWVVSAIGGRRIEWDSEIIDDRPNERIAWHSLPGADMPNTGSVVFEQGPGGRGTMISVDMRYEPPGGMIGTMVAKLFGEEPGQQLQEDLRNFKRLMETGEIIQSDATAKGWGAAQPPRENEIVYPHEGLLARQ